jgi:hypothetical protein
LIGLLQRLLHLLLLVSMCYFLQRSMAEQFGMEQLYWQWGKV